MAKSKKQPHPAKLEEPDKMAHGEELGEIRRSSFNPKRLLHWGPLVALGIIFTTAYFAMFCDLMLWPLHTPGGLVNLSMFSTWVLLILYHHFQALSIGPGFVKLGWRPKNPKDEAFLQYCKFCEGYKSPRSHHCRKCDRCVMKMDHHCPWINTCCGHLNHANFTYFLFFAPVGCLHAFYILVSSLYYGMNWRYYLHHGTGHEPRVFFTVPSVIGSLFAAGLAIGVTIAVGILFFVQAKSILKNETGIEGWIIQKEESRVREEDEDEDEDFVYPYNLGVWRNIREVFTWSGWPKSDGITWGVLPSCNQYTLTIAQLKQKAEKRSRLVTYEVARGYSGWWFPLFSQGLCICLSFPWSDETRVALEPGDTINVSRHRKRWLYGEKVITLSKGDYRRIRGWFPRRCVDEKSRKKSE